MNKPESISQIELNIILQILFGVIQYPAMLPDQFNLPITSQNIAKLILLNI